MLTCKASLDYDVNIKQTTWSFLLKRQMRYQKKYSVEDIKKMRQLYKRNKKKYSIGTLAKMYGVGRATMRRYLFQGGKAGYSFRMTKEEKEKRRKLKEREVEALEKQNEMLWEALKAFLT